MEQHIEVTISDDPATIGPVAHRADLEAYAAQLQSLLRLRFGDVHVHLGSVVRSVATNPAVEAYVRELETGDAWLQVLARSTARPQCGINHR